MIGGWSRDKSVVKLYTRRDIEVPEINKKVKIMPTHVVDVETFYGRILSNDSHANLDLAELNHKMNAIEYCSSYRKLDKPPIPQELVIAKHKPDGLWYRARIFCVYDKHTEDTYKVFYLDYGNCADVGQGDLRQWKNQLDYLPFQALPFRVENITNKSHHDQKAIDLMRKLISNRSMDAIVM